MKDINKHAKNQHSSLNPLIWHIIPMNSSCKLLCVLNEKHCDNNIFITPKMNHGTIIVFIFFIKKSLNSYLSLYTYPDKKKNNAKKNGSNITRKISLQYEECVITTNKIHIALAISIQIIRFLLFIFVI